jgi:hypothetical protein
MPLYHSILTGVALSDGKTHAVYKRANVDKELGDKALQDLVERGVVKLHTSPKTFRSWSEHEVIDKRVSFTSPFLRFWFAFVSPLFQGIKKNDYSEVKKRWENKKNDIFTQTFTQLAQSALEMEPYFDAKREFELYKQTKTNTQLGTCRYSNAKVKKSELTKLQEIAKECEITNPSFVIVAKKGFSSELKSLKGKNLKLLTLKHLMQS